MKTIPKNAIVVTLFNPFENENVPWRELHIVARETPRDQEGGMRESIYYVYDHETQAVSSLRHAERCRDPVWVCIRAEGCEPVILGGEDGCRVHIEDGCDSKGGHEVKLIRLVWRPSDERAEAPPAVAGVSGRAPSGIDSLTQLDDRLADAVAEEDEDRIDDLLDMRSDWTGS